MTLFGKIESYTELKSAPEKFHVVINREPYLSCDVSPKIIKGCNLCEGEWGIPGTVIDWTFVLDGKVFFSKELTEAIDNENNSATIKIIGGDILKLYKNFNYSVHVTPKEGGGSLVHWTMEYEKLNIDVPDPNTIMEITILVSKDMDDHLQKQA